MNKDLAPERWFLKLFRPAASVVRSIFRRRNDVVASRSPNAEVLESLGFPVAVINSQGEIISINRWWAESDCLTGVAMECSAGPGDDYFDIWRKAAAAGSRQAAAALAGIQGVCAGFTPSYELQYSCIEQGSERWFLMSVVPLRTPEGGAVITHRDVSELKRSESSLRDSEEKFLLIADKAPAMIWMAGADKRCVYFNKQWLDFTGRRLDQELGDGWIDGIHPDHRTRCLAAYGEAFERRQSFRLEHRLRCADGEYRWVLNTAVPLIRGNGEFGGLIGSCIDISDRRAAEETLVRLGGRLINAQEEERSRIARELHDDLSQKLALLSIDIEQLAQLASHSLPKVSSGMRGVLSRVQEISSEIHRLSYELHPSKLDRLGLAAASLSLCKEVSKQQSVNVECAFKNIPDSLPRNISLCLYRVIQESLQNVIKHSGACNASVELYGSASEIRLSITDEGVGFELEKAGKKGGLGLLSMRERLRLVGGTISIESLPLRGTRIDVRVPLVAADSESQPWMLGESMTRSPSR